LHSSLNKEREWEPLPLKRGERLLHCSLFLYNSELLRKDRRDKGKKERSFFLYPTPFVCTQEYKAGVTGLGPYDGLFLCNE
jgi:hypothetical protein